MSAKKMLMALVVLLAFIMLTGQMCTLPHNIVGPPLFTNAQGQQVREIQHWGFKSDFDHGFPPDEIRVEVYDPVTKRWYDGKWVDSADHNKGGKLTLAGEDERRRVLDPMAGTGGGSGNGGGGGGGGHGH